MRDGSGVLAVQDPLNYMNLMARVSSSVEQAFLEAVAVRIAGGMGDGAAAASTALPGASLEQAARRLLLSSRAKRARALLCAALGRHVGADPAAVVDCAAAIEMVHGASLLHDDVVDEADRRRGEPTARADGGNAFAVLAGDLVLARALALLASRGPAVVQATVAVVDEMTRAALVEIEDRGRFDVPQARWAAMAEGKTGALFGLCARLPALCAGFDEHSTQRLEHSLRRFGVAFQIVDDILDLQGGDAGKPRGQDVREQNPSLPILAAVARDSGLGPALARMGPNVDDAVLFSLCDRLLLAGRQTAVDAARVCVQDALAALGDDAQRLGDVVGWATRLVDDALAVDGGVGRGVDRGRGDAGGHDADAGGAPDRFVHDGHRGAGSKARSDEGIPARSP